MAFIERKMITDRNLGFGLGTSQTYGVTRDKLMIKQPWQKADHLPPFSAEVKE
jgi:hypothetical protein